MYFILGSFAYATGGILAPVLAIVVGFIRDTKRRTLIALAGIAAITLLGALTFGGSYSTRALRVDDVIEIVVGTSLWVAIGWGIGYVVRRLFAKPGAASNARAVASPNPSLHAADGGLAAQAILVRRALAAGQRLRTLAPPGVALAAVDQNLEVLAQARDRLATMHQPYEGDSLRRLQDVAAQFDVLLKQHGGGH